MSREAMEKALEWIRDEGIEWIGKGDEVKKALRAALAESADPVAWYRPSKECYDSAFRDHRTVMACTGGDWSEWIPLYTHPPAREAESVVNQQLTTELSDEEILAILKSVDPRTVRLPPGIAAFARAVLAARGKG